MYKEWRARTMAPVKLYVHWASSPSRAVMMTCEAAKINNEKIFVDLFKGEHMKPEFIKINPEHTVPTIIDGDFNLWESRPVCAYLIDSHAPDNALFPKDLKARAHIHRMMDFDNSVYKPIREYMAPRLFKNQETSPEEMEAMFQRLNDTVFHDKSYAVGTHPTLADIFMIASCTFPELLGYEISAAKYPNLVAWMQRIKSLDWYKGANVEFEKLKEEFKKKKEGK